MISGAFARAFRSAVQPVEISAALQREVDNNSQILSRDRRLVPNSFHVELSHSDMERLSAYDSALEDEAITALALKRLVARLGHEVCAVTAMAEDAIRLAGEILPDIILMDIRLAVEMDGITAAREIRERFGIVLRQAYACTELGDVAVTR